MTEESNVALEEELGIEVFKREQFVTYRQHVRLTKKDRVDAALAYLQQRLHEGKVTGKVLCQNLNQGGVTSIVTEQTGKVPLGSRLEKLTDEVFEKNLLDN